MPRQSLYRLTTAALAALLVLALPQPSFSAFDWLKNAQDLLGGGQTPTTTTSALSNTDIAAGLKEALRVGSERVVAQLGKVDGFNADPKIHIPLPPSLEKARSALNAVGMGGTFDDLELKLNRAAEQAVPEAKGLFLDAISQMTLEDVKAIYNGPDDAATRYFQGKMSAPLSAKMQPIVDQSLEQVGAVQAYNAALGQYRTLPFVPDVQADLTKYVIDKGMDGVFYYLAQEEAAIRKDPAQRTTALLQKVFGGK
jgi:Protein of unknown function (DUF4197)